MRAFYRLQSLPVACLILIVCGQPVSAQWNGCSPSGSYCLTSGNVGIGTNTPGAALHITASGAAGQALRLDNTADTTDYFNIFANTSNSGNYGLMFARGQTAYLVLGNSSSNSYFPTGRVGIGTTTPQSTLAVNGTITTTEVVVTATGWPDYILDNNHELTPLSEIASFVKENHHLPGIPSAAEVAEKGISLGEMQAKLLAKIEELTLHMIEAEKRSSRLEQENKDLRQDSEILKEHISRLESTAHR